MAIFQFICSHSKTNDDLYIDKLINNKIIGRDLFD